MKKALDRFSEQAGMYKKFRPNYPASLYREILRITPGRGVCWDCGTGNGQVAMELSRHFKAVYATDISEQQLARAPKLQNVYYGVERAESTGFPDSCFDLITVAQAIHWFDIPCFYQEVRRVGKPGAILAVWGYGLLKVSPGINRLIHRFYDSVVGPYWDFERKYIEAGYETIGFIFPEIQLAQGFMIEKNMDLADLRGYLNSWSAVQNYIKEIGTNPVGELVDQLLEYWPEGSKKGVSFPVFIKAGKIVK